MKKIFYLLVLILLNHSFILAQANWEWIKNDGQGATCVAADNFGNVYIAGRHSSPTSIGNIPLIGPSLYSSLFIAKYDSAGNFIWAKTMGGSGSVNGCNKIVCDKQGNIYLTGVFGGNKFYYGSDSLISAVTHNSFVIKMDSAGNYVWASIPGASYECTSNDITVSSDNFVYITGSFVGTFVFAGSTLASSPSVETFFIASYGELGNERWGESAFSNGYAEAFGVSADNKGNVIVSGVTAAHDLQFGNYTLTNPLFNTGYTGIFYCKFNAIGNLKWAKSISGGGDKPIVSSDKLGNSFLSGSFESDSLLIGTNVYYTDNNRTFLAKIDSSGQIIWSTAPSGSPINNYNKAYDICSDSIGNTYLTGNYSDSILYFDNATVINTKGHPFWDTYIAAYDSSGKALWASSINAVNGKKVNGSGIDCNTDGNIFVCGTFDSAYVGSIPLIANGTSDFFIGKITGITTGITENDNSSEILIYPNPSDGNFEIRFKEGMKNYSITDLSGRIISQGLTKGKTQLHFFDFNSGVYFISFSDDKIIVSKKLIVFR